MSPYAKLREGAEAVAAEAARTLVAMRRGPLRVSRKDLNDVVTEADIASERIVLDGLRRLTPNTAILSEEAGASGDLDGPHWIVDPLDGTVNYAAGLDWFSVTMAYKEAHRTRLGVLNAPLAGILALYEEGGAATVNGADVRVSAVSELADAVVSVIVTSHFSEAEVAQSADVIRRLGSRARGVRIIVSGGLEMALVASGRLDAFVSLKADAVSHAAAMPLVRAGGGRVSRLDGRDATDADLERITSNGLIHDELLDCLKARRTSRRRRRRLTSSLSPAAGLASLSTR